MIILYIDGTLKTVSDIYIYILEREPPVKTNAELIIQDMITQTTVRLPNNLIVIS